jgi:4a-hydroxytetrahydrobiopterin dehydratase
MSGLAKEACESCRTTKGRLAAQEIPGLLGQLHPDWGVLKGHHLERHFLFEDFRQALDFTNQVGELAETQGHHPDIRLAWGKVVIALWTHSVDGLSRADFVLAAKIDQLDAHAKTRRRQAPPPQAL